MILLSGADLVLPDRVISGDLVIEDDRITDLLSTSRPAGFDGLQLDLPTTTSFPASSTCTCTASTALDTLEGSSAIGEIAGHLPRYGVTAFCPTSIACSPDVLRRMLAAVRVARTTRVPGGSACAAGTPREQLHQSRLHEARSRSTASGCRRRLRARRSTPRPDRGAVTTSSMRSPPRARTSASSPSLRSSTAGSN